MVPQAEDSEVDLALEDSVEDLEEDLEDTLEEEVVVVDSEVDPVVVVVAKFSDMSMSTLLQMSQRILNQESSEFQEELISM